MRLDASIFETMRAISANFGLDKPALRKLHQAIDNDKGIRAATLGCGTEIACIPDCEDFLKCKHRRTPDPERFFHHEDYYTAGTTLCERLGVPRTTLQGAISRGDVPSVVLAFGTRLVDPRDVQRWHKQYVLKVHKHSDGRTGNLSQWALMTNIPANVLYVRISSGKNITQAVEMGGQKGGR